MIVQSSLLVPVLDFLSLLMFLGMYDGFELLVEVIEGSYFENSGWLGEFLDDPVDFLRESSVAELGL